MSPRPPPSSIASIVTSGPGAFPREGRAGLAVRPWPVNAAPWSRGSGPRRHGSALLDEEVGVTQEAGLEAGFDVERGVELLLEEPHALGAERQALPQQSAAWAGTSASPATRAAATRTGGVERSRPVGPAFRRGSVARVLAAAMAEPSIARKGRAAPWMNPGTLHRIARLG